MMLFGIYWNIIKYKFEGLDIINKNGIWFGKMRVAREVGARRARAAAVVIDCLPDLTWMDGHIDLLALWHIPIVDVDGRFCLLCMHTFMFR